MGYRERYRHLRNLGYDPQRARRGAKSGCYIATAVYGSYDCPQVWTLRRYRDNVLAHSISGKIFIEVYYKLSPIAVKLFGNSKWFQTFWKKRLDIFVDK